MQLHPLRPTINHNQQVPIALRGRLQFGDQVCTQPLQGSRGLDARRQRELPVKASSLLATPWAPVSKHETILPKPGPPKVESDSLVQALSSHMPQLFVVITNDLFPHASPRDNPPPLPSTVEQLKAIPLRIIKSNLKPPRSGQYPLSRLLGNARELAPPIQEVYKCEVLSRILEAQQQKVLMTRPTIDWKFRGRALPCPTTKASKTDLANCRCATPPGRLSCTRLARPSMTTTLHRQWYIHQRFLLATSTL